MALIAALASAYSNGQLFGKLVAVVFLAALILHFWKASPTKSEIAPAAPPPPQRSLSTYGQPAEPPPPAPVTRPAAGTAAQGGRPGWAAPAVWGIAAVAAIAIIASHEDPNSLSKKDRQDFVRGCDANAQGRINCGCMLDQLIAKGYDTDAEMRTIAEHTRDAVTAGNAASLPPDYVAAVRSCVTQQQ